MSAHGSIVRNYFTYVYDTRVGSSTETRRFPLFHRQRFSSIHRDHNLSAEAYFCQRPLALGHCDRRCYSFPLGSKLYNRHPAFSRKAFERENPDLSGTADVSWQFPSAVDTVG